MSKKLSKELLGFIEKSPSAFHAIEAAKQELVKQGFTEVVESKAWKLKKSGKYFVTRNNSSIIAFSIGSTISNYSFNITASHSDSPVFKIKENYKVESTKYIQLNTEKYGGMIYSTWFDRPLSVAGRIVLKEKGKVVTKLVNVDRDLLIIPNVAIHMNREMNSGFKYNEQVDLLPLYGKKDESSTDFLDVVAKAAKVKKSDILGHDLFLYNRDKGTIWGGDEEFISSPRLDDLQCAFSSLKAFLAADNKKSINVYCCFDNEEVGSQTKQGAQSTFLIDTLNRINEGIGKSKEDLYRALASSFMLSADNAHSVHPNHPEKSDPTNRVYINEGIVIKHNANQRYTTDGVSAAIFKSICDKVSVPYQAYTNRSDIAGGGTLGNVATVNASIKMVDIGLAQLAMHSSYETAGIKDTEHMIKAMTEFYNTHFEDADSFTVEMK